MPGSGHAQVGSTLGSNRICSSCSLPLPFGWAYAGDAGHGLDGRPNRVLGEGGVVVYLALGVSGSFCRKK